MVKVGAAAGQAAPSSGPGRPQFARFHDAMERYLAGERLLRALGHEPLRGPGSSDAVTARPADLGARKRHESGLRPNPVERGKHDGGGEA